MLERDSGPTTRITYLVTADLDLEKCSSDHAKNKLADALTWVEGAGRVDVTYIPASLTPDQQKELGG